MIATLDRSVRADFGSQRSARSLLGLLDTWVQRHRQRRALLELNDSLLKDIGVSRAEAWNEGQKPFWRT